MDDKKIKAIIFDVDGVVFKTYDEHGSYLWSRNIKEDLGITQKHFSFIFSKKWEDIIRGKKDLHSHLQTVFKEELFKNLEISPIQYIHYWLSNDHQVNQEVLSLVKNLKIPCYLGTNQESLRTKHILNSVGSLFVECFASYQMGFIKPEKEFFYFIQKKLSLLPYELLLIDDTKSNIDGAKKCGWHVYHYQNSIDGLIDFFQKNKLLNQ